MKEAPCPSCEAAATRISASSLARLAAEFRASSEGPFADEETRLKRLARCESCESLDFGSSCRHCGCLVALRALLAEKNCPCPGDDRWRGL